jgi:hypothetical protein
MLEISTRDLVKVRLTGFGEAVLAKYKIDEYLRSGGTLNAGIEPQIEDEQARYIFSRFGPDQDGFCAFQIEELMEIFGSSMRYAAVQIPFADRTLFLFLSEGVIG